MTRQEKIARAIASVVARKHYEATPKLKGHTTPQELADEMWPMLMEEAESVNKALGAAIMVSH
jgi:hypothetical protein